jgi:hypothetical protein
MKKEILLTIFLFAILLFPLISAEIVINEAPKSLYNFGDIISIPIKITSLAESGEIFTMNLICEGVQTEIHKEYLFIQAGGVEARNPPVPLMKNFIGDLKGNCRIKYSFGSETKLTNEFIISDLINLNINTKEKNFAPEQQITIDGNAIKENGENVNGFVNMEFVQNNESENIFVSDTVRNGTFSLKFSVPKNTASGRYPLKINVYEKDSKGETTNSGFYNYNIFITQIPANLEIIFDNKEIEPGEIIKVKAVLHDQTGEQISSMARITILNDNEKIIEQKEIATDEFLELQIPSSTPPADWKVMASSNGFESNSNFAIKAVEKINTEIINKTLIITNIGNVLYNHAVLVKIGEHPLNLDVLLDVGESKKYLLSAPDGEYAVDVVVNGISNANQNVLLTGKTIEIQESGFILENNTIIWVLVILVLGFIGLRLFKRRHKRSYFGYAPNAKSFGESKKETVQLKKSSVVARNKAELSLSIKGDQQDVSMICLRIKNIDKLKQSKTDYEKVLQEIVNLAEEQKAYVYGAQENIFLIYAPVKTRTFRNEKTAMEIAQKIEKIISSYNKLAREKIFFGISVNHGTIIASSEGNIFKFMSLGTLMNASKKLASVSDGEVLLSDKIREKLGAEIKTQKKETSGVVGYAIREVRDDEKSKEFIRRFMQRMEK